MSKFKRRSPWEYIYYDSNFQYSSDKAKEKVARIISFGRNKDYVIRIIWSDISKMNKKGKWISGWLKE